MLVLLCVLLSGFLTLDAVDNSRSRLVCQLSGVCDLGLAALLRLDACILGVLDNTEDIELLSNLQCHAVLADPGDRAVDRAVVPLAGHIDLDRDGIRLVLDIALECDQNGVTHFDFFGLAADLRPVIQFEAVSVGRIDREKHLGLAHFGDDSGGFVDLIRFVLFRDIDTPGVRVLVQIPVVRNLDLCSLRDLSGDLRLIIHRERNCQRFARDSE